MNQLGKSQLLIHALLIALICIAGVWAYSGMEKKSTDVSDSKKDDSGEEQIMMNHDQHMNMNAATSSNESSIKSNDEAVRSYLDAAQVLAEVYKYTNNGKYSGLCENSEERYTLEGDSGGILKFIKMVGATEVYCYTADSGYMIEAKLPENGMFYCIDSAGDAVEQAMTKEEVHKCTQ